MDALSKDYPARTTPSLQCDVRLLELPDSLLDLLPFGFYACGLDGTITRCNRAARALWGWAPKMADPQLRFSGAMRLLRPDGSELPVRDSPMAEVLRTGIPKVDQEVTIERLDGTRVVVLETTGVITDDRGKVAGAVSCFRPAAEVPHDDATGDDSREMLDALPAAVYVTDAAGRISYFNGAAVALWGFRPANAAAGWEQSWRLYHQDGRPMAYEESPMAVALKSGERISGIEVIGERPDGGRVPFLAFSAPQRDGSGAVTGAINTLIDISELRRENEARQRLAAIVECSDDAIISKDLNGIITSWNRSAERLFGYTADEAVGRSVMILIPPERSDEETDIIARIRRGDRVDHYETVRRRKNGSLIDISLTVSPIVDVQGRVIGASKIARDITERKRAQEQQNLLLREMDHRVKNLFALAIGVVALSGRSARTPEEMSKAVRDRLAALSRAHGLTLRELAGAPHALDRPTTLDALARAIILPHLERAEDAQRMVIEGPEVPVGRSALTSLALLLHEFATNAAKYGALSTSQGRIEVTWRLEDDRLRLTWTERGGPPVAGPAAYEGFGTMLAQRTVTAQLNGEIHREWQPEGLVLHLTASLSRLAS